MPEVEYKLKSYQDKFLFSTARFPALISGIGTGKSMCLIFKVVKHCEDYPGALVLMVRKEFTDLRDSTMKDFEKYTGLKIRSDKEVHFSNGSIIMFRHGAELNVLKNINLTAFGIEQAEEFESSEQFIFLRDRLRNTAAEIRQGIIIGNVNGHNWIWELWKNSPDKEYELIEATTFDNEDNLPADFIADIRKMERDAPSHFQQYVMNNWDEAVDGRWVIPINLIENAQKHNIVFPELKRIIVCDPSLGNDETVMQSIENTRIIAEKVLPAGFRDTMKIAGELIIFKRQQEANAIVIDSIGIGRGISDRLTELGHKVIDICSSEKARDSQFVNVRAEMWWQAGKKFMDNQIDLGDITKFDYDTLKKQLSSVLYIVVDSSGKIQIEKKEDIIKRLGCSPDHADCYIMGLYGLQFAPIIERTIKDAYANFDTPKSKSFMAA